MGKIQQGAGNVSQRVEIKAQNTREHFFQSSIVQKVSINRDLKTMLIDVDHVCFMLEYYCIINLIFTSSLNVTDSRLSSFGKSLQIVASVCCS